MNHLKFRLSSAQLAGDVFVVTLRGEIDVSQASEVERELEALEGNGARHVVVELLEVPFFDSALIPVLLWHSRRLRMTGGELTLVSDKQDVKRAIGTHLFGRLRVVTTLSAALHEGTAAAPSAGS